jgi:precorrin-3B synthase
MTALAAAHRRGACPGLSAPMQTGDGLLVRLHPLGTMSLVAFAQLCAAARTHGNGIVEITSRGSIQVRGLNAVSAPRFAADVAALGIAAADGIPILCNALAGLDAEEIFDAAELAADLRRRLAQRATELGAKVCVAVDGGGALNLADVATDIRLTAEAFSGGVALRVGIGGDEAGAIDLGTVAFAHGAKIATRLLDVIARRGRDLRARDILAAEGAAVFRAAIADLRDDDSPPPAPRRSREPIGLHRLRDGALACGIGLAFGHADTTSLERLADAAAAAGASGLRAAPGRVLMTIGLTAETASAFVAVAEQLGFIVRADDPRRHVVACAGAPICASAHIAARAIAPHIAAAAPQLGAARIIHISGCAKGCAHASPAALTVVGTSEGCALVANGSARDIPFAVVPHHELPSAIAKHMREPSHV